ncbi:PKD domain-containing protein [Kitasatospora sp. NPDC003701]
MSSVVAGTALPSVAQAEASVLYVDNRASAHCSDAGEGTQAQPYCTIQAAADVAQPGQTVQIAGNGDYSEQVTVKRSGTEGRPITFKGAWGISQPSVMVGTSRQTPETRDLPHAFVLSGVHDIVLSQLYLGSPQEAVLVQDSERVVLDRDHVVAAGRPRVTDGVPNFPAPAPGVRITGASKGVTVSRSLIRLSGTAGLVVEAGATGTVVTASQLSENKAGGLVVTDAPGTVVTGNTVTLNCQGDSVALLGDSPRAAVENNIVTGAVRSTTCGSPVPGTGLVVSAGSVAGTVVDYNVVYPATGTAGYSWGGTAYPSASQFRATGQGGHDLSVDPRLAKSGEYFVPAAAEGVTDAADADAPGQLDTDLWGLARVDDPNIANQGTGVGYHDRGAVDTHDLISASVHATDTPVAGRPLRGQVTGSVTPGWSLAGATLDFGDGSAPLTSLGAGNFTVDHDFAGVGTYTVTLTVTSTAGVVRTATSTVTTRRVDDLYAAFWVTQADSSTTTVGIADGSRSPWPVDRYTVDWGDGSPASVGYGSLPTGLTHEYPTSGFFNVTLAILDDHGRSAAATTRPYVLGPTNGVPVAGRFGAPNSQVGLFYNGQWAVSYQKTTGRASMSYLFGEPGDLPTVGQWDAGNPEQAGIYRSSTATFGLKHADYSVTAVPFGEPGDLPAVGAWDHNGHDQLAVYRPSSSLLAVRHDNGSVTTLRFGDPTDIPLVGDWDRTGHAQFGVFRPGRNPGDPNLFILRHDNGTVSTASYGVKGDLPVVGDWLRQGRATFGIFRPSSRTFALSNAYAGQADSVFQILG